MATQNGESKTKYFEKTHCIWEMTKFLELINENNTVDQEPNCTFVIQKVICPRFRVLQKGYLYDSRKLGLHIQI